MFRPVLFSELGRYTKSTFRADLLAGLTVGVVALPMAMAFAIACNFPPERGLYTAIVAGFLISLFGGCKVQIGGPTGAFIVIISSITLKYGYDGLVLSTLMAGVFLIIFGLCKMGALLKFIPFPVTTGFTSGIAVVIFSTQVKELFGLKIENVPVEFVPKWACYFENIRMIDLTSTLLGIGTIAVIVFFRRLFPKIPSMLMGMLIATLISYAFNLNVETIGGRFGDLPRTLPMPKLVSFDWAQLPDLVMPALTIALLAGIESLLSATVADGMTGERHRSNTELIGEGIGNIGAMFFGGIPATGAIARTATNIKSGGKTPVAGIIHAITLCAILLVFAPFAKAIPLAALAGILVVVCFNMCEFNVFVGMFKGPKSDWMVMVLTFVLTVMVDLVLAVEVGVVLAALLFIRRMSEISNVRVISEEIDSDDESTEDTLAISQRKVPEHVAVFEVQGPFFFGAVDQFKDCVLNKFDRKDKVVILRMRHVPSIDATALHVLEEFYHSCAKKNIKIILSGIYGNTQIFHALMRYGFIRIVGRQNVCSDIDKAIKRSRDLLNEEEK